MAPSGWIAAILLHWRREGGQTMAEYAVVLSVLAIVTMVAYVALGDAIEGTINTVRAFLA